MPYNIYQFQEEDRGADIIMDNAAFALNVSNATFAASGSFATTVLNVFGGAAANNTIAPLVRFVSNITQGNALFVGRTVAGSVSIAPFVLGVLSAASAPAIDFESFVSITSVVLTTVANTDYAIRVMVGASPRWIPLFKDAGIVGAAAF